jgi:hypothetical protein
MLEPIDTEVSCRRSGVVASETEPCGTQSGTRVYVVLAWYSALTWRVKVRKVVMIQPARS